MDQGGKRRNQVDTAVMSVIRRQRGSSTASCAGLQSRQFSAHAGDARADQGVVADEPEGKADQDRRERLHHARYVAFQMAEVAIPKNLFADILRFIAELRQPPDAVPA